MAAAAGIWNHNAAAAGQSLTGATPLANGASGTNSTSGTSSNPSTISANDFLTLLVTELQNQDPTATTDPNEYINQLVEVNSLEQLIDINQTLTTATGSTTNGSSGSATGQANGATTSGVTTGATAQTHPAAHKAGALAGVQSAAAGVATARTTAAYTAGAKQAPGNLSVPEAIPAAHRVAQALGGRASTNSIAGGLSGAR